MSNPRTRPCEAAAIRAIPAASERASRAKAWVLVVTILASTIAYVDESVVNVALPAIEADLKTSVAVLQWLVNAYLLALSALLLVGGAAGDRFGRRRVFVIGLGLFTAASVACGFAPSVAPLIVARAVQGIGAALLIPCSLALIGASFDESERGKAIGTWAGFSAVSAAIGPLLGGWIVDHAAWRWIFLINPFLALPAILIALRYVPESSDPDAPQSIDWRGAVLAFAGLGSLVLGLIALPARGLWDWSVTASLAVGVLLLLAFVWQEGRSPAPMMPLALFRSRLFSSVNLLTLLLYAALGGAIFFLPFALIQVHGYTATAAGMTFLPLTAVMALLSRWSGGLLDRFGARLPLAVGPAIAGVGFLLLAWPDAATPYWLAFLLPMIVLGLGMAVTVAPLTTSVINAVATHQAGVASGINNAVASVANLIAVALFGAVALGVYNHALDRRVAAQPVAAEVQQAVENARGQFAADLTAVPNESRAIAQAIVKDALSESIRIVMLLAAALAFASALHVALSIGPKRRSAPVDVAS